MEVVWKYIALSRSSRHRRFSVCILGIPSGDPVEIEKPQKVAKIKKVIIKRSSGYKGSSGGLIEVEDPQEFF